MVINRIEIISEGKLFNLRRNGSFKILCAHFEKCDKLLMIMRES